MNTPRVDHAIRAINPDAKFAVFDVFTLHAFKLRCKKYQ